MQAAGAHSANFTATRSMSAAFRPVMPAAHSGVYCPRVAAHSSKPVACSDTNFSSYRPRSTSTWLMASTSARSVPGLMGSHSSAKAMELFRRGSTSTMYAPFSCAFSRACSWLGRMASA